MGLMIDSTGICVEKEVMGNLNHARIAIDECIQKTNIERDSIKLIINISIYRDSNIVEPAMSTLIQKKSNLNKIPQSLEKSSFSFDLMNGSCGFLNAAQIIGAYAQIDSKIPAMIVSCEGHPSRKPHSDFPYTPIGSAVLLSHNDNGKGFKKFLFKNSIEENFGVKSCIDLSIKEINWKNEIKISIEDNYYFKLLQFTLETLKEYNNSGEIDLSKIDHIICSQIMPNFGRKIRDFFGLKNCIVTDFYDEYGDTHSSALIMGYHIASEKEILKENDQILFIGASSGHTLALATYIV